MNVLFHAYDHGLLVVQIRTAFVHFAVFKIIFPRFPQIPGNLGKPEPARSNRNLGIFLNNGSRASSQNPEAGFGIWLWCVCVSACVRACVSEWVSEGVRE